MNLVFDSGNTRLKAGLVDQSELVRTCSFGLDVTDDLLRMEDQLRAFLGGDVIDRAGIASVVPAVLERVREVMAASGLPSPLVIRNAMRLPFEMHYHTPQTLGADRLASAAAAWVLHGLPAERSVVSIDAGTATTYEVVRRDGAFLGGAIAAGPRVQARALASATAQLPEVEIDLDVTPIGRSTRAAIQAGIQFGFIDSVAGMIGRIERELKDRPLIVLTGGWASVLQEHLAEVDHHDPHLVLRGVDILMSLNA